MARMTSWDTQCHIKRNDPTALQPGMTLHCVPILFHKEYLMCFSESILVTKSGCEVLTQYPREWFEVNG